jgi:Rad3-related DNA helicase
MRRRGLDRASFECRIDPPTSLFAAADALLDALSADAGGPERDAAITELVFDLARFGRVVGWFDAERFGVFLRGRGRDIEIHVRCLDSGVAIADTLKEYRAHVRFSATVSPFEVTARAHGSPEARRLRLPSPFPADRLGVFVVPDVTTLYRQRRASLSALVGVIDTMVVARSGNYLIALPSFDYLDLVADAYEATHPEQACVRQARTMTDEARAGFIEAFAAERAIVAFAVLGGVFTESIDLPEGALRGIAVVGIGLPPPTLERDAMAELFGSPMGRMLAYEQPAMTRVVQAAGRLIRRATDRGVVCLIDGRYLSAVYRAYLPSHWQPVRTPTRGLAGALAAFWARSAD